MASAPSLTRFASPELARSIIGRYGEAGEEWLSDVETLIDSYARRWKLTIGDPVHGGRSSVLVRARTEAGVEALLKVVPNPILASREFEALRFFGQSSASITVLESDVDGGALLLEHLDPAIPFTEHDDGPETFRAVGRTLRSLHDLPPDERSNAYLGARDYYIYERLCQAARRLHTLERGLTVPTMNDMHAALDICERLLDTRERDDRLLHGDPSPGNILWAGKDRGMVAIDPQPSIGERALDAAICAVKSSWGRHVHPRAVAIAEGAGYDPNRVWLWSRVVSLDHCVAHNTHGYGDADERAALLATARGTRT